MQKRKHIPVTLLCKALKEGFTKELYLLELLLHNSCEFVIIEGGWVSEKDLIRLFLCHAKTRATAKRWIQLLEGRGWLHYSNGNYHVRAMWRILQDHGIGGAKKLCVEVRATHMRSHRDFKSFCLDAHQQKQLQENWRRRHDPKYRVKSSRTNQGTAKFRPDPKSYSVSLGNERGLWDRNKGEYALRLAATSLGISLAEVGRLAKFSEQKGESKRTQFFCPKFDELNISTLTQLFGFIKSQEDPAIHARRFVKMGDKFRMKVGMLLETTLTFCYKRYYS